ncbi:MAG: hypothetical protein GY852_07240, partial [bacterium]|nr:hypothetical protein [bacterium]
MNFDRHWATGVLLADSTVVRCIQDVWALPVVADSVYLRARNFSVEPSPGGVDSLISILLETKLAYLSVLDTLSCTDSLALLCSGMWARDDSAGTPGEWGILHSSRGIPVPFGPEEVELDLEEYTRLLTRWPGVEDPSPELL